jgi:hypothetical protein
MANMRLPNGIEIILSTEEVLEIANKCAPSNCSIVTVQERKPSDKNQVALPSKDEIPLPFSDEELDDMFSVDKLVKSIEDRGRPFSYSLREEQLKRLGRYYDNHHPDEQPIYGKVYRAFERVKKQMQEKYGGKWVAKRASKGGIRDTLYTLVEDVLGSIEHKTTNMQNEAKPQENKEGEKKFFFED